MKTVQHQSGITYVETLIAVVLMGVCLAPALDALASGLRNMQSVAENTQQLTCLKSHMERITAEPFSNLLQAAEAAGSIATPTAYSLAANAQCPARQTFIARYDPENTAGAFVDYDSGLLFVRSIAVDSPFSFTTLVTRQ